jgi:hypothetical protein
VASIAAGSIGRKRDFHRRREYASSRREEESGGRKTLLQLSKEEEGRGVSGRTIMSLKGEVMTRDGNARDADGGGLLGSREKDAKASCSGSLKTRGRF